MREEFQDKRRKELKFLEQRERTEVPAKLNPSLAETHRRFHSRI